MPRKLLLLVPLLLLSGCELLSDMKLTSAKQKNELTLCENTNQKAAFLEFCELDSWLNFLIKMQSQSWTDVFEQIQLLDDSSLGQLKKILLSQHPDTPYRNRLRAQNWVVKINNQASQDMQNVLDILAFSTSQQLLEFESAITLLSRVNARQQKTIAELQSQLEAREKDLQTQQEQVEQLLKIESDLLEQNRNTQK